MALFQNSLLRLVFQLLTDLLKHAHAFLQMFNVSHEEIAHPQLQRFLALSNQLHADALDLGFLRLVNRGVAPFSASLCLHRVESVTVQ